jgi:cytochrome c oxidase subunit 2
MNSVVSKAYGKAAWGLPLQGSDVAVMWDQLYWFLFWLSVFFFILVVGGMLYFAIVYRKQEGKKTKYIVDHHALEAFWTIIPTILLLGIFGWGWVVYKKQISAPSDAVEVRVIGKQWQWTFQYDDGTTANHLVVQVGKPVRLLMTSQDVLHDFFIPNFRVKQDVVPGMYTTVWFEPKVTGEHQVFCAEYCGTTHSGMLARIIVLDAEKYDLWKSGKLKIKDDTKIASKTEIQLADASTDKVDGTQSSATTLAAIHIPLPQQGAKLVEAKGCVACHSLDGSSKIGPSYKGIFGKEVELTDGSKVVVDENYIRESIQKPQAKIVKGFNPVMPPYTKDMIGDEDMNAIVSYIKSLN